jgi:hypothetical protein
VMIVTGATGAILSAVNPAFGWALLQLTGFGTSIVTAVASALTAVPGSAIQVGNWPASWSVAETAGVVAALTTLAVMTRRTVLIR